MNALGGRPSSDFSDDHDVIVEIERILPQIMVAFLRERLSQDDMYDKAHGNALTELKERFGQIGFTVNNPTLGRKFEQFKRSVISLDDLLITEFGLDRNRKDIFSMHPNRKNIEGYHELKLKVNQAYESFQKAYRNLLTTSLSLRRKTSASQPVSLTDFTVRFSDAKGAIFVGETCCVLPAYRNGHCLSRIMFSRKKNEPVDWSEVATEMIGFDPTDKPPYHKALRSVRDAMYAVNRLVKREANTGDEMFSWKNKTIVRNY